MEHEINQKSQVQLDAIQRLLGKGDSMAALNAAFWVGYSQRIREEIRSDLAEYVLEGDR